MSWQLRGEYFENCNCEILCPCITSLTQGPADYDRCRVPLICRIDAGERDGVSLDGLCFILLLDTPQVMAQGDWRVAVYIDERADDSQREALGAILSGREGGPPEGIGALTGELLGVKFVPIQYETVGTHKRVVVPGIMEFEVEPVTNPSGEVLEVTNTLHSMGADLPIAKGVTGRYDDPDYGLAFDNTGKNGHFREFAWSS
jgi:hypothetical protein